MIKKILSILLIFICIFYLYRVYCFYNLSPTEHFQIAMEKNNRRQYHSAARHFSMALPLPEAYYRLGLLFDMGKGVPYDTDLAVQLIQKAASLNHPESLYVLGVFVERGYLNENPMPYYIRSAKLGNKNAIATLISIYALNNNIEKMNYWKEKL